MCVPSPIPVTATDVTSWDQLLLFLSLFRKLPWRKRWCWFVLFVHVGNDDVVSIFDRFILGSVTQASVTEHNFASRFEKLFNPILKNNNTSKICWSMSTTKSKRIKYFYLELDVSAYKYILTSKHRVAEMIALLSQRALLVPLKNFFFGACMGGTYCRNEPRNGHRIL